MAINLFLYTFSLLVVMGMIVFISKYKHLLTMLLSLEYVVLSLFILITMLLSFNNFHLFFLMIFLTFSVCEGSLGISILVSMIRTHGNDYFQSLNILQC